MVLLSEKHPIDITIGQELPPTFHYAWVILTLDAWLLAYLKAGGLEDAPKTAPLFRALDIRDWSRLTARPMTDQRMRDVLKIRLKAAGLPKEIRPHSFRVFVVTDLLLQEVPLEDVQHLAGHATPKTTQIYDRRARAVTRALSS